MNEEIKKLEGLNLNNGITIGHGVTFVGSISARGKAFINGQVTGEVTVEDLQVGQYGIIKGNIKSIKMDIHGQVHDDVSCADHVLVHSTGLVNGNLIYGELEIHKGGRVTGSMVQSNKPPNSR